MHCCSQSNFVSNCEEFAECPVEFPGLFLFFFLFGEVVELRRIIKFTRQYFVNVAYLFIDLFIAVRWSRIECAFKNVLPLAGDAPFETFSEDEAALWPRHGRVRNSRHLKYSSSKSHGIRNTTKYLNIECLF